MTNLDALDLKNEEAMKKINDEDELEATYSNSCKSEVRFPLLNDKNTAEISYGGTDVNSVHSKLSPQRLNTNSNSIMKQIRGEAQLMAKLAFPVIGGKLLEIFPDTCLIIMVGHVQSDLTNEYLDAYTLSVMFINLTGLSIGFGLASAMDTLCSQANGAGEPHKMGIYLQTGMIVLCIAFIVEFLLTYHATSIFITLGQPKLISELAGTCAMYLLPGIPFLYLYELLRKILQAQSIALPMLYIAVIGNVINVGLGYYLIYFTSFGWLGAPVARIVCNFSFCILMLLYLYASGLHQTYWGDGWHPKAAWRGMSQFVALGIPGALQLCFEWWAFECLTLISGRLPNAVLAMGSNSILMSICTLTYMPYLGVSIAGNVRIGNALGAGSPKRAKLAAAVSLGFAVLLSGLCAFFLILFHSSLPSLFTNNPELRSSTSNLLIVGAIFQLPDSINGAVQGMFRGCGRQNIGAYLNFVAYYIVGIPFGVLLAFYFDQGILGLWIGIGSGLLLASMVGSFIIFKSDWIAIAKETVERLNH